MSLLDQPPDLPSSRDGAAYGNLTLIVPERFALIPHSISEWAMCWGDERNDDGKRT